MKFNLFKKKPKIEEIEKELPKENIDYKFIDNIGKTKEVTSVEILKGDFEGVSYCYGKVKIVHEETPPRLEFDYYIIEPGNLTFEELKTNENFSIMMGDILVSIFDNNILKKEKSADESIRADHPEKFNLQ